MMMTRKQSNSRPTIGPRGEKRTGPAGGPDGSQAGEYPLAPSTGIRAIQPVPPAPRSPRRLPMGPAEAGRARWDQSMPEVSHTPHLHVVRDGQRPSSGWAANGGNGPQRPDHSAPQGAERGVRGRDCPQGGSSKKKSRPTKKKQAVLLLLLGVEREGRLPQAIPGGGRASLVLLHHRGCAASPSAGGVVFLQRRGGSGGTAAR